MVDAAESEGEEVAATPLADKKHLSPEWSGCFPQVSVGHGAYGVRAVTEAVLGYYTWKINPRLARANHCTVIGSFVVVI